MKADDVCILWEEACTGILLFWRKWWWQLLCVLILFYHYYSSDHFAGSGCCYFTFSLEAWYVKMIQGFFQHYSPLFEGSIIIISEKKPEEEGGKLMVFTIEWEDYTMYCYYSVLLILINYYYYLGWAIDMGRGWHFSWCLGMAPAQLCLRLVPFWRRAWQAAAAGVQTSIMRRRLFQLFLLKTINFLSISACYYY